MTNMPAPSAIVSVRPTPVWSALWVVVMLVASAACSEHSDGPAPALSSERALPVEPAIVCGDQLTSVLDLNGERFSPVTVDVPAKPVVALPSLTLQRSAALDGAAIDEVQVVYGGDPTRPSNTDALRWLDPEHMQFTVHQQLSIAGEQGRIPAGVYDARVINPNGKAIARPAVLAVVDRPTLTQPSPGLLCLAGGERELALSGAGLLRMDSTLPRLRVSDKAEPIALTQLSDCSAVAQSDLDAELCATGTVTLAEAAIAPGLYDLELTNPEPAACHSEEGLSLRVVGAPEIEAVTAALVCSLEERPELSIRGAGFLEIDGQPPLVRLADRDVPVSGIDDCETLETPGLAVRSCKRIQLRPDVAALGVGDIKVEVENPEPAGCAASADGLLRIAAPPQISGIRPAQLCSELPTTLTVSGTGFDPAATAEIDGQAADVTFVSSTEVRVEVSGLDPGEHAFTLTNLGSCSTTVSDALLVERSPITFYVDPPVLYGEVPAVVTVFTAGLATAASKVELVRMAGEQREALTFTSPTRPNQIFAEVPAGLAQGSWDVVVENPGGCRGTLASGLTISGTLDDGLVSGIKPSYASTVEATAVTISGSGLAPVPRVYLTPSAAEGTARALRAVEVKADGQLLTAVIPSGLAPDTYDLIVVNPDGKVAVLEAGVTIIAEAPPVVAAVTPASLPENKSGLIIITGTGLLPALEAELDCLTPGGTRVTIAGVLQTLNQEGTRANVSIGLTGADAGSICLVRVTNPDGAFFEYSAFSVTTGSLNLSPWEQVPSLQTPRRALALVAGRPTATSRYLYAIGGDEGAADPSARGAQVYDTIESSQVDVFGRLSAWADQRNRLIGPRTAAGAAKVGQFVYVLGGHDGSDVTDSVQRAVILDPLAAPEIVDVDATLSDGTKGLDEGLYYYRVSAVMTDTDSSNPGGETLPSELVPVQLPQRDERVAVALTWRPVPGAHGYRVYRSSASSTTALALLGEVSCGSASTGCDCDTDPAACRFTDDGADTSVGQTPLPAGSLGRWHSVDGARCAAADCSLLTAREGLAVAAVADPADSTRYFLYAFGGRDASGGYLDSYEVATVTLAPDGGQTVAAFAAGSDTLASPRADLGMWVMNKLNASVIATSSTPDGVWVYVGGGRTTGGGAARTLEVGQVGANGVLSTFSNASSLNADLIGFGTGASNDQLYTFGGLPNTASGTSAKLSAPSTLGSFNNLGAATTRRMFAGSTQESAFFFVAGGHDGTSTLTSAQSTVQ